MNYAKSFEDLLVWQKARQLAKEVYEVTLKFPDYEKYGLADQMRRAAISITSNIAEGFKRKGRKDSLKYYNIASASLEELRSQTILACDFAYVLQNKYEKLRLFEEEVSKMLNVWILRNR